MREIGLVSDVIRGWRIRGIKARCRNCSGPMKNKERDIDLFAREFLFYFINSINRRLIVYVRRIESRISFLSKTSQL